MAHDSHTVETLIQKVLHPIAKRHSPQGVQFEFCQYLPHRRYESQTQTVYRVKSGDVEKWLQERLQHQRVGFELGLSSRVYLKNAAAGEEEIRHIPMIDCKGNHLSGLKSIELFLRQQIPEIEALSWFSSGRSFHAYGQGLLTYEDWVRFLGSLLLLPAMPDTTHPDARWIGHRLRDGFCCLRWTNHSGKFKKSPSLLTQPSLRIRSEAPKKLEIA